MAMDREPPSWAQALGRIAAFGVRTAVGVVEYRQPVDADEYGQDEEGSCRFWYAAPRSWRVEDQAGVRHVQDSEWAYLRRPGGGMLRLHRPTMGFADFGGHPATLLGNDDDRVERFTRGDDFSVPQGPPVPVEVADRPCWEIRLAASPENTSKPHLLRVAVDDATGAVLRMQVPELGAHVTAVEFHPDVELEPALFTWDGPVEEDHEDELAALRRSEEWLAEQQLPVPRWWPDGVGYTADHGDPQTGAFSVHLEVPGYPSLARWPVASSEPAWWRERTAGRHRHEWSDDAWRWSLAVDEPLAAEQLARVVESNPRTPSIAHE